MASKKIKNNTNNKSTVISIVVSIMFIIFAYFVAFFKWINPYEVQYVSKCLFIICLGILLLINSMTLKKAVNCFIL